MSSEPTSKSCHTGDCKCDTGLSRRSFLKLSAAGAALGANAMPVMAGPFENKNDYLRLIPVDKRLDPAWVRSLFERGEKQTYSEPAALSHIGMPIGGLFAGTVYLSGDGRLWLWDIFNRDQEGIQPREVDYQGEGVRTRNGANYIEPAKPDSPFQQGFSIRLGDKVRTLDSKGFSNVTFDGRYPIGRVTYRDNVSPVEVTLEAFSPFIPLNADDSSLPATVMSFCVKNTSDEDVEAQLLGHIENPVCLNTGAGRPGQRRNRVVRDDTLSAIVCSAEPAKAASEKPRDDIVFEDFEKTTYDGWTTEGEAFGDGPVEMKNIPDYQGDVGGQGQRVANSHATAPGNDVRDKDSRVGTLTSKPFTIERKFIRFLVGGGAHRDKTCVNLLVDGQVVASITGRSNNRMQPAAFNVIRHQGREAQLQVVDRESSGWGNIGVDQIVFSDRPPASGDLEEQPDFGTMTITLLGRETNDRGSASLDSAEAVDQATGELDDSLIGQLGRTVRLKPGERAVVDFALTWHFPNFISRGVGGHRVGHYYASRFDSALAVARYLAANIERLGQTTRAWVETWYNSSLPHWLLDRTMANTSTLATTTCYRFEDGRFWAWEGIGCCPGTCTHVWHYAQAPGRLFPEVERIERQRVNFGIGLHEDGGIGMRTGLTNSNHSADDGQCGRILGVLREHQMSADNGFLEELWPKVKKAVQFMIQRDGNSDGILEGAQPNTLDAAWYGKISFISSLYLAALRAGEAMAREMGDGEFADQCRAIAEKGAEGILETYNGEYFVQIEDPAHKDAIGVGPGCYIDQIFGQTWAHWVGLDRLFDRDKQLSALRALWKYNFVPDVGPFREHFKRGRWYATAGDAGLLMCTWPKGGQNAAFEKHWQYQYFNECMSGFEWQAAAHMVWEGGDQSDLLESGLAVSRAIHDRYDASLRNPYNEIECSDHYARAMASYGVFLAVCGYESHGPRGHLGFAPRLAPDDFHAAFTAAEGWGSYRQTRQADKQTCCIDLRYGKLRLQSLAVTAKGFQPSRVTVTVEGHVVAATLEREGERVSVRLGQEVVLEPEESLQLELT